MKIEKVENLVDNLHHKTECFPHNKFNVHRVIKFNQKSWLILYIDMNTDLRQAAKNISKKIFSGC